MGPVVSVSTSLTLLAYSVDYDVSGVSPFLCCENDTNAYILKAHSHSKSGGSIWAPFSVSAIDILYTLDSASLIEAKNIPAVTPIWIDGGHVRVSHSLINA
jgi:hypothetical protein